MKKVLFLLLTIFTCLSCEKTIDIQPKLELSKKTINLDNKGGVSTFHLTSILDWTIATSSEWIQISDSAGKAVENKEITITVAPNNELIDKVGAIIVKSGTLVDTITITQLELVEQSKLELSKQVIGLDIDGGVEKVLLTSSANWEATVSKGWIKISDYSGQAVENKEITITVEPNDELVDRVGEIIIKSGTLVDTLTVTQVKFVGKYTNGTFILNEGNMSSDTGSLLYINSSGELIDNVYELENGSKLPGLTQDMFTYKDEIFIIGQQRSLIICDANTLKLKKQYTNELGIPRNENSSHIAVANRDVFIATVNGYVYRFNLDTESGVRIDESKYPTKNRMVVINEKVYTTSGSNVLIFEAGKNTVTKVTVPGGRQGISLKPSSDGNLWLCGGPGYGSEKINAIMKMDVTNHTFEINPVDYTMTVGRRSSPVIGAIGDVLYFYNSVRAKNDIGVYVTKSQIIRHVFSEKTTVALPIELQDHLDYKDGFAYNGIGVNSETNEIYVNMIKGFGADYKTNDILVFNIKEDNLVLKKKYSNYLRFPAGVFFTSEFSKIDILR